MKKIELTAAVFAVAWHCANNVSVKGNEVLLHAEIMSKFTDYIRTDKSSDQMIFDPCEIEFTDEQFEHLTRCVQNRINNGVPGSLAPHYAELTDLLRSLSKGDGSDGSEKDGPPELPKE